MKFWREPFDRAEKAVEPGRILISKERCKGCDFCVDYCPRGALRMSKELGPNGYYLAEVEDDTRCLTCGLCEILCPEFAIRATVSHSEG